MPLGVVDFFSFERNSMSIVFSKDFSWLPLVLLKGPFDLRVPVAFSFLEKFKVEFPKCLVDGVAGFLSNSRGDVVILGVLSG